MIPLFLFELYLLRRAVADFVPGVAESAPKETKQQADARRAREAILRFLSGKDPMPASAITAHFGFLPTTTHSHLSRMAEDGSVIKITGGTRRLYRINGDFNA